MLVDVGGVRARLTGRDHIIYALLLIVLALTAAGRTGGLGRAWESTTLVQRQPWLS